MTFYSMIGNVPNKENNLREKISKIQKKIQGSVGVENFTDVQTRLCFSKFQKIYLCLPNSNVSKSN